MDFMSNGVIAEREGFGLVLHNGIGVGLFPPKVALIKGCDSASMAIVVNAQTDARVI